MRDLSWSVLDAGTLYGAILVERIRSYDQRLLDLSDHSARLFRGARTLGIDLSSTSFDMQSSANRLVSLNRDLVQQHGDVSLVLLLSPGEPSLRGGERKGPTLMMHLGPLPFAKLDQWYTHGVDLFLGSQQVVPNDCWPSHIKSRSRLPYYLSDCLGAPQEANSLAILTTAKGCLADTSVANVLIVDGSGQIISPKKEDILIGCTLLALERLLLKRGVRIQFQDILPDVLREAKEVILTGSNGGVWFGRSFEGLPIGNGELGEHAKRAIEIWKEYVAFDYVAQAAKYRPN